MIRRIGELAVHQQILSGKISELSEDHDLDPESRKLGQLSREAHDIAMSLRMVPVRPIMRTLKRTCRDTSLKLGKSVDFVTEGEGAELDLALVQVISDALVHLVRNSVDHGIETPDQRGEKPECATLRVSVAQQGGNVEIEVSDDGRGLNTERIRKKAIDLGWIGEEDKIPREQLWEFLFKPGFSTSQEVTEFSGRGVGLDVVVSSIRELDGVVTVESEPGEGTVFRIRLPLSLSVVDVMQVELDREHYLIPLHTIQETVAVSGNDVHQTGAGRTTMMMLRGRPVPLHELKSVLTPANIAAPEELQFQSAIVTEWRSQRLAFGVDDIIGRQQVVVKPLGQELSHVSGISGSAILGDGRVGLIVDLPALISARGLAAA